MKKLKYCLPAIIWMLFIFIMSSQDGPNSSNTSSFFVDIIVSIFSSLKDNYELIGTIIRKGAHMLEYTILSGLVFYAVFNIYKNNLFIITFVISFLYACSDEIHQLFIVNRTGQFLDVLIDSCGIIIALIIIYIKLKKNKTHN